MPTVNGPDEITTLTGTADRVIYLNSSGDVTELALGAANTVLTSQGATSAPTFAAAGGGAWTLEAADTTERGFTNSSDAQLFQITGLSIAAEKPLKIFAYLYQTVDQSGWTTSPTFYVRGFNGTQIADYGPQFYADSNNKYIWQYEITWGPRESPSSRNYAYANTVTAGVIRDNGSTSSTYATWSGSMPYTQANPSNSSVPTTSTITSIEFGTIGYSTDQFYCKNVFVYSLAVS